MTGFSRTGPGAVLVCSASIWTLVSSRLTSSCSQAGVIGHPGGDGRPVGLIQGDLVVREHVREHADRGQRPAQLVPGDGQVRALPLQRGPQRAF